MRKMNLFVMTCVIGSVVFAVEVTPSYKDVNTETTSVRTCFSEFKEAFNKREMAKVKTLTGRSATRWLRWSNGDEKIDKIEVVDISFGAKTEALVRVDIIGGEKGPYQFDARFIMATKDDGSYIIEDMSLPESDLKNSLFEASVATSKSLIKAINDRDISCVKELIACDQTVDLERELQKRGLMWIKEAIDSGVMISRKQMAMQRNGEKIIGRISVPSAIGGTNVVRQVSFKDTKIDWDVPVVDLSAERRKRLEKLQSDAIRMREKIQREMNQ